MKSPARSKTSATPESSVVRINPRFPENTARKLREASALRGQSVSNFIIEIMTREANRVVEEESRWKLGTEEAEKIQKLLIKPPAINAAARKAAKDLAAHVRIRS
jgi:uncharacterized protein (DUF1778 family)